MRRGGEPIFKGKLGKKDGGHKLKSKKYVRK